MANRDSNEWIDKFKIQDGNLRELFKKLEEKTDLEKKVTFVTGLMKMTIHNLKIDINNDIQNDIQKFHKCYEDLLKNTKESTSIAVVQDYTENLIKHISSICNNLDDIVAECLFPLSDENQASNEKVSKISPSLYQIWSHLGKMQLTYHGLRSKVANPEFSDLIKRRKNEMRDEIRRRILLSSQTDLFNDFCHIIFRLQIRFFNKLMKIFSYIPDLSFLVGATKNLFFCSEERNAYSAPNNIGKIISETKSFLSQNDSDNHNM